VTASITEKRVKKPKTHFSSQDPELEFFIWKIWTLFWKVTLKKYKNIHICLVDAYKVLSTSMLRFDLHKRKKWGSKSKYIFFIFKIRFCPFCTSQIMQYYLTKNYWDVDQICKYPKKCFWIFIKLQIAWTIFSKNQAPWSSGVKLTHWSYFADWKVFSKNICITNG
jgi:hypothetical protein